MKRKHLALIATAVAAVVAFTGCTAAPETASETTIAPEETTVASSAPQVVNLYTDRHYESDDALYQKFTDATGIAVNVVKGKGDELIERLKTEGADTEADLLVLADAGKLSQAKAADLLQPAISDVLTGNIPEKFRDVDGHWFGITKRARIIAYAKDRVKPEDLSTYAALTEPRWEKKVVIRSSENVYNQSIMASFIALYGEASAKEWAAGIVKNMARDPEGGDRDQAKAVVAGIGDVAVMNTYYLGQMLNSADEEEKKVAEAIGVFFPDQEAQGTHVNISGIGITKAAKNNEAALLLMEFLSGEEAQKDYADSNYEYPVNPMVEPSDLLKSWGTFKEQELSLNILGDLNTEAVRLMGEVGWK